MTDANEATMRALIFEGPNRMVLRDVPRPKPGAGEVLIRVHAAAICGTDVRIMTGRKTRDVRVGYPIGHECAGTVVAVGPGAEGYTIGQRVAVCVVVSCGTCAHCRADHENLCETRITLGYHTDGAFAEHMPIPAHAVSRGNLFALPESIPMATATLLEPLACCINGQREMLLGDDARDADPQRGKSLVIFGAGPIGMLHLMLARARGVDHVTVVEPRASRRDLASRFGADDVVGSEQFDAVEAFDAAILAVGVEELVKVAMRAVKKGGKVSLFAGFDAGASVTVDPNLIHYHQTRITGASESRRRDYAEAMALVLEGKIDPAPLITHRFALDEHEAAFRTAADGSALKVLFEMG